MQISEIFLKVVLKKPSKQKLASPDEGNREEFLLIQNSFFLDIWEYNEIPIQHTMILHTR